MGANHKAHYSCAFCRSRKLRCDRPLPCTNCATRGKTCHFRPDAGQQAHTPKSPAPAADAPWQQRRQPASGVSLPALPSPNAIALDQKGLLAEIRNLKKLASDLEKRVTESTTQPRDSGLDHVPSASASSPGASILDASPPLSLELGDEGEVGKVVAHLDRVSMGHSSRELSHTDDLMLKIERIETIPHAPAYRAHRGKQVRVVSLPRLHETKALVDTFVNNINYIYHIVHHPSLPSFIDDFYSRITRSEPVNPGSTVLLLSIIASAALVWTPADCVDAEDQLFTSSAEATAQSPLWVKATLDVLNGGENGPPLALETIQGIIILSFLVCNLEGFSLRYRMLVSTGLLLGRELCLHRIDRESNEAANTVEAEMGRRAWWYLVATDWLMAAQYGSPGETVYQTNPRQMIVNKPRNINDVDLLTGSQFPEPPLSQPSEMSYFLQRIRLAEIARSIADHDAMAVSGSAKLSYYAHVMAMDVELDQMIHDIPPFFNLGIYDRCSPSDRGDVFIQAHLLNTIMHTQRCKLHLGYLTSRPNRTSPAYASSWEACLKSAREINRAEKQLERTGHPFVLIRRRLSGIMYGAFMASVVVLMNACVNGSGSGGDEACRSEAAEALRVVEEARGYSPVAATLYDSLSQVLARHRAQAQRPQPGDASDADTSSTDATAVDVHPGCRLLEPVKIQAQAAPPDDSHKGDSLLDQPHFTDGQPSDSDQLVQDLEGLMDIDGFQWDDLFLGIDSFPFL